MKTTPLNCRQRLKAEGKAYPRSNCASCGSLAPNSKVCDAALEAQPEAPKVEQDYSEMKRLAEGASPGPWKACGTIYEHMNCEIRTGSKGEGQPIGQIWDGPNAFADGQFIAAASPEIVLGLIARASSPAPASDELLEAVEAFMPSAEVAFLWTKETPPADEVQRYRERYWAVKEAIAKHRGPQS